MAAGKKVIVEFLGKDQSLSRTARDAEQNVGRLGSRMKKVGLIAGAGLVAGAGLAGKALFEMGKQAADDQVSTALLARQLQKSAGATKAQVAQTEDYITAQGKLLGVTDDELRPALGTLVAATHDVHKAQTLASLAMDISAARGLSLKTVTKALANGENGRVTGLAKLGIATKDAHGKTIDMATATKELSDQFGGAAATKANTLQGRMQRLKVMFDETKESIGYKLLPVAEKLAAWFLKSGVPAISKFSAELQKDLGPVIEWVRGLFSSNTTSMSSDVSKNLMAIKQTFQSVVSIIQVLWSTFGGTITAVARGAMNFIRQYVGGQLQIVAGVFKTISALLHGDWAGTWAGIQQILRGAWQMLHAILSAGWAVLKATFRLGGTAVKGIFSAMWSGVKALARAGLNGIVDAVKALPGRLKALGGLLKAGGKSVLTAILNGLKGAGGFAGSFASSIWGAIKHAINNGIDKLNSLLDFKIAIRGAPDIHVNAPNIGHLATGTDYWRGGPTWVGEKGPEILNLPRGSRVTANDKISAGGDTYLPVQLMVDGRVLAQSLVKLKKDLGRDPLAT